MTEETKVSRSPYETLVRDIDIMQEMLRGLHGALARQHVALFWTSVHTLHDQARNIQNSATIWFDASRESQEDTMSSGTYTTLLSCMAVDGGPKDCCGCFNGREQADGSVEFFCNECGRAVFNAEPRKKEAANA